MVINIQFIKKRKDKVIINNKINYLYQTYFSKCSQSVVWNNVLTSIEKYPHIYIWLKYNDFLKNVLDEYNYKHLNEKIEKKEK